MLGLMEVADVKTGQADLDGERMMRILREKVIAQAMLRLVCRRYIDAVCMARVGEAKRLFAFYRKLEQLHNEVLGTSQKS